MSSQRADTTRSQAVRSASRYATCTDAEFVKVFEASGCEETSSVSAFSAGLLIHAMPGDIATVRASMNEVHGSGTDEAPADNLGF